MSPLIKDKNENDNETIHNVNKFAVRGFRTLVFCMREITEMSAAEILKPTMDPKPLERDYQLLGVSGVEDLLQDDVGQCIHDFQEAGINVWMLTGDKGETAL